MPIINTTPAVVGGIIKQISGTQGSDQVVKDIQVQGHKLIFTYGDSGCINIINVDGTPLPIDPTYKSVDIDLSGKADVFTVETIGSGNAVTAVSYANNKITATKGATYLTQHQDISGKSDVGHTHAISDVTNLQTTLDGKAASSHNHDGRYWQVLGDLGSSYTMTYSDFNQAYPCRRKVNTFATNGESPDGANIGDYYLYSLGHTDNRGYSIIIAVTPRLNGTNAGTRMFIGHFWNGAWKGWTEVAPTTSIPTALSQLSDDSTHRLVTDTEKTTWSNKSNLAIGTTSSTAAAGNHTHGNIANDGSISSNKGTLVVTNSSTGKLEASGTALSTLAPKASPALTGTPTAPTADPGTNTTQIATTAFVMNAFQANDAMIFKGTVNAATDLPATHYQGWTYKVATAGAYLGQNCEVGDMIICVTDGTAANNAHWAIIQNNIDGAVTGPVSATADRFASFNGATGKIIKDSGYSASSFQPAGTYLTLYNSATNNTTISNWGTLKSANGYAHVAGIHGDQGSDLAIASKGGQMSVQIDGFFYQNEGSKKVVDESYASSDNALAIIYNSNGTGASGTSTSYARKDHKHAITLATGDSNGQVKIAGTNVDVKGLGSAAYTESTAYLGSGTAVDKVQQRSWSSNEEGRLAVKAGIDDSNRTDYMYFTPGVTVNGSTKVITAGGFKGPLLGGNAKQFSFGGISSFRVTTVSGGDTVTLNQTNNNWWRICSVTKDQYIANNRSWHVKFHVVCVNSANTRYTSDNHSTSISCNYAYRHEFLVELDMAKTGTNMRIKNNTDTNEGSGIYSIRALTPKSDSYGPQIELFKYYNASTDSSTNAFKSSGTDCQVYITILEDDIGLTWENNANNKPTTTAYNSNYWNSTQHNVGQYNHDFVTHTLRANITGNADGRVFDSVLNDRYYAGATAAWYHKNSSNAVTQYAVVNSRPIGTGSDGKVYHISTPEKAFALPFTGGRAGSNYGLNNNAVAVYQLARGCATTELTNTIVANTANLSASTTYTGTGTAYAHNWVFRTHTSSIQWTDATTLTIGKNMYICGNLDSNGNFQPYYTYTSGQTVTVPSGQGGFTANTNVTMGKYTFYITQNPTYTDNYDTFLFFAKADRETGRFSYWTYSATAYTYNEWGNITHIDGKRVSNRLVDSSSDSSIKLRKPYYISGEYAELGADLLKLASYSSSGSAQLSVNLLKFEDLSSGASASAQLTTNWMGTLVPTLYLNNGSNQTAEYSTTGVDITKSSSSSSSHCELDSHGLSFTNNDGNMNISSTGWISHANSSNAEDLYISPDAFRIGGLMVNNCVNMTRSTLLVRYTDPSTFAFTETYIQGGAIFANTYNTLSIDPGYTSLNLGFIISGGINGSKALTVDSDFTTSTAATITGTITQNQIPLFNANSSGVLKQSGVTIATSLTSNSDANVPTSKAVATYVTNLGYKKITASTSEPTSSDGANGDIWIVYEV